MVSQLVTEIDEQTGGGTREVLTELFKMENGRDYFSGIIPDDFETGMKISQATINMVQNLPPKSPLRKPIIQHFGHCVETSSELANLFQVSNATISRSLQLEDNYLLEMKYPVKVKRDRFGDAKVQIAEWYKTTFPVVSGSSRSILDKSTGKRVQVHLQTDTDQGVYEQYKIDFGSRGHMIHSYNFVVRTCKPKEVSNTNSILFYSIRLHYFISFTFYFPSILFMVGTNSSFTWYC